MSAGRLVILGATGDLTGRYLLPALAELAEAGSLPDDLDVVGISQDDWDDERFREHAEARLAEHADHVPEDARRSIVARSSYLGGDATDPDLLARAVDGAGGPVLAYLALPPAVFAAAIDGLAVAGLAEGSRIVVEKPFGTDLGSAEALNAQLHEHFEEHAVFRMDHFLGMQTVQNLLGLRFANRLFEPLWCAEHIASVEIVWEETVALEGRAGYYDETGALVDMVQNHLLQVLALVALERPDDLGESSLRDAKLQALQAVRRLTPEDVAADTRRARYTAGTVDGRSVPDYVAEDGVDPDAGTETFAEVTLLLDNDRWRDVPFVLRTGKALAADRREIRIHLRPTEGIGQDRSEALEANVLTLTMDPDRLLANILLNGAGDPFVLERSCWELELAPQSRSAYARLVLDAIEGDPVLSIRGDEAEECWRIVEPIVATWASGEPPLETYGAGSDGPSQH